MLTLDFLRMALADDMPVEWQVALVRAPVVRQETRDSERLQKLLQLQKRRVRPIPEDVGKDGSCRMVDRMPQPAPVVLLADETPHLVDLGRDDFSNLDTDFAGAPTLENRPVNRLESRLFFLARE